ncbi:hypothetical protein [Alishewanella longhuensis]
MHNDRPLTHEVTPFKPLLKNLRHKMLEPMHTLDAELGNDYTAQQTQLKE